MSYDQHLGEIAKIYENSTPQLEEEINIFKILNLEYDEVRLHSRILKFLIEREPHNFIEAVFPNSNWDIGEFRVVKLEVPTEDGRIDLLLEFEKHFFIIENKILASDQPEQLKKYFKFGESIKKSGKECLLLYLTPEGKLPGEKSISKDGEEDLKENIDFFTISYEKNILNWLEHFENSKEKTGIKNIIDQYLNTIKTICGIMTEDEKKRITALLSILANNQINEQENSFEKLSEIKSDIERIENKIHEFWRKVSEKLSEELSEEPFVEKDIKQSSCSIMFDICKKGRGQYNLYLDYKLNLAAPSFGFWVNNTHHNNLNFNDELKNDEYEISPLGFLEKTESKDDLNGLFNQGDLIKFIGSNKEEETNTKISEIVLRLKEIFEKNRKLIDILKKNLG
jgi:hypothetical protein